MKGNLSKRKGLLSSITQEELEIMAEVVSEQKEDKKNKVTAVDDESTDTQYPSARAVHLIDTDLKSRIEGLGKGTTTLLAAKENLSNKVTKIEKYSSHKPYPSALAVYFALQELKKSAEDMLASEVSQIELNLDGKVDKVEGKGLSSNDYTTEDKVALQTAQTQISDLLLHLNSKVDKVSGKGLSSNDFTDDEKGKLAGLPTSHDLIGSFEQKINKVTAVNENSTDTQYPTAKAVYHFVMPIKTEVFDIGCLVEMKEDTNNKTTSLWSTVTETQYPSAKAVKDYAQEKTTIEEHPPEAFPFTVGENNTEYRLTAEAITTLAIDFPNGEYDKDYIEGLVFNSGPTPTHVSYTSTGIIQWIGTDCFISDDNKSIFKPSANMQYDIVFYYNGGDYIVGLVNGYKVATANQEANA